MIKIEIAEFLMKIITIGALTVGILGMIFQSASFKGQINTWDNKIIINDFAQAILNAPCLVEQINGESRKGLFDVEKLNNIEDNFCLTLDKEYLITISEIDSGKKWEIKSNGFNEKTENSGIFPVAIKYSDDNIKLGELVIDV